MILSDAQLHELLTLSWGGPRYPSYEGRLGGGQANSGQASQAASQQTAASNQDMALSAQYGGQQKQIFNSLFGNGSPGSSGTLTGMMNPANLTQTSLNPAYQAQFNQGKEQIGQSTSQQRGQLAQSFANSGATGNSTPTGFQADQMRQLGSSQADAQGQLYSGLMGSQYNNALTNFWNANNVASGSSASATGGSTTGAGNSGSSSAQVYGTAGQPTPGALNSAIGAAGAVGGGLASNAKLASCPRRGSLILMIDGTEKLVETLTAGDLIAGGDGKPCIVESAKPYEETVLRIVTSDGCVCDVSGSHAMMTPAGGFVIAFESIGRRVITKHGTGKVIGVTLGGGRGQVFDILTDGSHSYRANGIWAWGVRDLPSDAYLELPEVYEKLLKLEA